MNVPERMTGAVRSNRRKIKELLSGYDLYRRVQNGKIYQQYFNDDTNSTIYDIEYTVWDFK